MSLTPEQIAMIQKSFSQIEAPPEAVAALFYKRLFELDPSLRSLFPDDMTVQGRKLMEMLNTVVTGLEHLDRLVPAVRDLGKRHVTYGVQDTHYETVGSALLWTLKQGLGTEFTDEVQTAWATAYGVLSSTMKDAAHAVTH